MQASHTHAAHASARADALIWLLVLGGRTHPPDLSRTGSGDADGQIARGPHGRRPVVARRTAGPGGEGGCRGRRVQRIAFRIKHDSNHIDQRRADETGRLSRTAHERARKNGMRRRQWRCHVSCSPLPNVSLSARWFCPRDASIVWTPGSARESEGWRSKTDRQVHRRESPRKSGDHGQPMSVASVSGQVSPHADIVLDVCASQPPFDSPGRKGCGERACVLSNPSNADMTPLPTAPVRTWSARWGAPLAAALPVAVLYHPTCPSQRPSSARPLSWAC